MIENNAPATSMAQSIEMLTSEVELLLSVTKELSSRLEPYMPIETVAASGRPAPDVPRPPRPIFPERIAMQAYNVRQAADTIQEILTKSAL